MTVPDPDPAGWQPFDDPGFITQRVLQFHDKLSVLVGTNKGGSPLEVCKARVAGAAGDERIPIGFGFEDG